MNTIRIIAALIAMATGTAVFAEGDPDAGQQLFKRCVSCHIIVDDEGNVLVDGGITGPNLFGVVGRLAGTEGDYLNGGPRLPVGMYTDAMKNAGEAGLVWTEENLAEFVKNPVGFVQTFTGDDQRRVNMSVRLSRGGEDIAAYLAGFSK